MLDLDIYGIVGDIPGWVWVDRLVSNFEKQATMAWCDDQKCLMDHTSRYVGEVKICGLAVYNMLLNIKSKD